MIEITKSDFDTNSVIDSVRSENVGAIVTFVGTVRNFTRVPQEDGTDRTVDVQELTIDTYDNMALEKMTGIKEFAKAQFNINDMSIVHRKGTLKPSDKIVMIAVSAAHRKEAFSACEYAIEELKKIVPIWKKEVGVNGEYWVGEQMKEEGQ